MVTIRIYCMFMNTFNKINKLILFMHYNDINKLGLGYSIICIKIYFLFILAY